MSLQLCVYFYKLSRLFQSVPYWAGLGSLSLSLGWMILFICSLLEMVIVFFPLNLFRLSFATLLLDYPGFVNLSIYFFDIYSSAIIHICNLYI